MTLLNFTTANMLTLGLLGLALNRTHLISALLCLEMTVLALFMTFGLIAQLHQLATFTLQPLILLTLAGCEASMALALLVASTRTYASDHLNNLNLLKC